MADKEISSLPKVPKITEGSMLPVYVPGSTSPAQAATGAQFAAFAQETVKAEISKAHNAATEAQQYSEDAQSAADRAETARDSILLDEQALTQAVQDAAGSANTSVSAADRAETGASEAKEWAAKAQAEAERATIPAVNHVYNVVLADRETGERYALIMKNGRLSILGVADTLDATAMRLIDVDTGIAYELIMENGRLKTLEVE